MTIHVRTRLEGVPMFQRAFRQMRWAVVGMSAAGAMLALPGVAASQSGQAGPQPLTP